MQRKFTHPNGCNLTHRSNDLFHPDENPNAKFLTEFLPMVADDIDGVTYHLYPGGTIIDVES